MAFPSLTSLLLPTTDTQNIQEDRKPFITAPCAPCCEVFPPRNAQGACPAPRALPPAQGSSGPCGSLSSAPRQGCLHFAQLKGTVATCQSPRAPFNWGYSEPAALPVVGTGRADPRAHQAGNPTTQRGAAVSGATAGTEPLVGLAWGAAAPRRSLTHGCGVRETRGISCCPCPRNSWPVSL